ncbi:MAG: sulfotransferase domain-containing protein [Pseudomonadota bacterium]
MKKSIVWLASYPKSGNTWTRVFLANYFLNTKEPLSINQVHRFGTGDSIPKMYQMVAGRQIDTNDLHLTLSLHEKVLRGIVANDADVNIVKTHNTRVPVFGYDLAPEKYSKSAIYIVRNPLDMLLSYAKHYGQTHEHTVTCLNSHDNGSSPDKTSVWQFHGTWSDHIKSWTENVPFPVLTLRYEDLLENPHEFFAPTVRFFGAPVDEERLDRAIQFSSFKELRKQEDDTGFVEKSPKTDKFFGKGTAGHWRDELDPALVKQIRQRHKKMMKKYGYYSE